MGDGHGANPTTSPDHVKTISLALPNFSAKLASAMPYDDEPRTAKSITTRYEHAAAQRLVFMTHWQEVADLVLPTRDFTRTYYAGQKRHNRIFSDRATTNHSRFSGALSGLLINPATQWFGLRTENEQINVYPDVQAWLRDCRDRMLAVFNDPRHGFYACANELFQDLVAFGTGGMSITEPYGKGIFFQARPLAEFVLDEDPEGQVDTVYRKFWYTPKQAYQQFGDALSDKVKDAMGRDNAQYMDQKVWFIHCVEPRKLRDPGKMDGANKRFASYYVEVDAQKIVEESGFDSFPYVTPRFDKMAGERYGRSPAMQVLSSIKMANQLRRITIIAGEKRIDPPVVADNDGFMGPLSLNPGGVIYVQSGRDVNNMIKPLELGGNPEISKEMTAEVNEEIDNAFYRDLFDAPKIDRQTADEFNQRTKERMAILSPVLARVQGEFLTPIIQRLFRVMKDSNMFQPAPQVMRGLRLIPEYVSPLAIAQKASELAGIQQLLSMIQPVGQVYQAVYDNIDFDYLLRYDAHLLNITPGILKNPQVVAAMRQQQAQAQQQAQQAQQMQTMAGAAKDGGAAAKNLEQAPNATRAMAGAISGGRRVA